MELKGSISGAQTLKGNLSDATTLSGSISTAPGQGTKDYNRLENKPTLNAITIEGDKDSLDYHLQHKLDFATRHDVEKILYLD